MTIFRTLLPCLVAVPLLSAAPPDEKPLLGFGEKSAAEQRALEAKLDGLVSTDNLRDWMKRLAARPHHLGSSYDKENADFIAGLFKSWGYDTSIETFEVLFPTPKTRLLEMTAPSAFKATLAESPLAEDATSGQTDEQLPVYNAYSIDGDVSGELVYVNYGVPKDYEELEQRGIDVKGKIVIARYYGSWRGIKPKVAAEHGAIGCIIYSDPREDGYFQGDVYPKGAYRNARGAQRGSVMDMPLYPGDPLTPGVGATADAKRLALKDAPTLTKIPVLPVSYEDALPLLLAIGGPVAPEGWRGALPQTYHLGPGPAKVRLKLEFDWKRVPTYNVLARMPGAERPEQWVLRGNHHDAWVNGAADPVSGMITVMEEARVLGELAKAGWRPKRTIVYCAWDGEEQGLLGSTEWGETHAAELREHAVAYINSDGYGRGFLHVSGSHPLEKLVNQAARDVVDPQKNISVLERQRALRLTRGSAEEQKETRDHEDVRLGALGSGSDYTVFLDHLGIASMDVGFGGESGGGSYHSIFDSIDHYFRFGDPGFPYGAALVKVAGRIVLRLANSDLLPFDFAASADVIAGYAKEVVKLTDEMREETERRNRLIREGRFDAAADPREPYVAQKPKEPVPHLNYAPLHNAVDRLKRASQTFEQARRDLEKSGKAPAPDAAKALDAVLFRSERSLAREEGLPRRPWFRHAIYAPGFYTGYGVKTLPGIREAIEERKWDEAGAQIDATAGAIARFAGDIERAAELLRAAVRD
ncbi:MAG TPA: transferrin receptor-like dimerization domain-containing protein [Planctomycetota bacterium]|nr:transferrin receptor-like dimerization domain-containing protein [Planctomycetota bacterium]